MNKLSTKVDEQSVIVFHDKSKKWVTKAQAEHIFNASCEPGQKGILIDGSFYTFSAISKILSLKDFYDQFPDERPAETRNQFEDVYGSVGNQQIRKPTGRAKEMMVEGFIKQRMHVGKTREEAKQDLAHIKELTN
jgi:hypothetical protein